MSTTTWIVLSLAIHTASSYVLLTANIDDVATVAKQLLTPDVVSQFRGAMRRTAGSLDKVGLLDQLSNLWKRASYQFKRELNDPGPSYRLRTGATGGKNRRTFKPSAQDMEEVKDREPKVEHHYDDDELLALGKNASVYLQSIRKLFNNLR